MNANPHLAFPLRFRVDRFLAVDERSRRHLEDQAEVLVRTRPGTLEAAPSFGLRNLAGTLGPVAPDVLAAVERTVPGLPAVTEGLPTRVRDVVVDVMDTDAEG